MVNTNIQGVVPLEGTGYIAKRKNNYERGEFKHLTNAEIALDGVIKTRRNIKATPGTWSMTNPLGLLGYVGDYTIIASTTEQRAVSKAGDVLLWAPTSLPIPAGGWHRLVGVFRYNKINYWITLEYNPTGTTYKICLYSSNKDLTATLFGDLTRTEIITVTTAPRIANFYTHKERLFITTDAFVYFSKATDPKVFAVPDGGFLGIADTKINYSFPLSDSIFILGDNSTHIYSYSIDPNADGYMRPISTTVGGEWGVAHQSQPYLINKTGLYAITNSVVTKVNDAMFDLGENVYQSKILSFEDYLVIVRRQAINYNSLANTDNSYRNNLGRMFTPGLANNDNGYNVFFINTRNGSTHVVDFTDAKDLVNPGYIVDALVNPNRDLTDGEYSLMFLTNRFESLVGSNYTYKGSTYYMEIQRLEAVADSCRKSDNSIVKYKPNIIIEVDSFTPDGSEHLMKKFRHMLLMAKFPSSDFGILTVYDNMQYGNRVPTVLINDITTGRAHYPSRVGLNQRGRSLTFKLATINPNDEILTDWDELEISDIRVLWTYTQRAIEKKSQTVSNFI